MKITLLLFANLREKIGKNRLELDLPDEATVGDLKNYLIQQYPVIRAHLNKVLVSVNRELALDGELIPDGAEVAIMPPVSGGCDRRTIIQIVDIPIDQDALISSLCSEKTGAVCAFSGVVRGVTERGNPHRTDALEYEAYAQMAEEKMRQIAAEIRMRWQKIQGIGIVHRMGRLYPGMVSVVVVCSAGHRDEGIFEAARYGIERIKEIVPIWKKELGPEGEIWVEETM